MTLTSRLKLFRWITLVLLLRSAVALGDGDYLVTVEDLTVLQGSVTRTSEHLELVGDSKGAILLDASGPARQLDAYSRLEIHIDTEKLKTLSIVFIPEDETSDAYTVRLPFDAQDNVVSLALPQIPEFQGALSKLGLIAEVSPGENARVYSVKLYQISTFERIKRQFFGLYPRRFWRTNEINGYRGYGGSFAASPPVFSFLAVFAGVLVAYGLYSVVRGGRLGFRWHYVSVIFFMTWLCLDGLWQLRLSQFAANSLEIYSGKTLEQKLALSPDSEAAAFASLVKESVRNANARLFIVSDGDYNSMVVAYYLAPLNVFWDRRNPVIPEPKYLRRGDYLVLVSPHSVQYNPDINALRAVQGAPLAADVLEVHRAGALAQVR